jgi:dihydroanticapsin dehydrogenase
MELELTNRVAVVTGGASGIGAACARALANEGMSVALLDRNPKTGVDVISGIIDRGGTALFIETDVTDESSVASAVGEVVTRFGALDVLLTSAGVSGPVGKKVTEMSRAEWDQVIAVNVTGIFLAAKHCLPHLEKSPVGTAVLIGSDASFSAFTGMAPYCTSKGAVLMLARSLAADHPAVRVNCLCPSVVDTPMVRRDLGLDDAGIEKVPFPVMSADQLARHALFLASPVSAPINGTSLIADFGYSARTAFPTLEFAG